MIFKFISDLLKSKFVKLILFSIKPLTLRTLNRDYKFMKTGAIHVIFDLDSFQSSYLKCSVIK